MKRFKVIVYPPSHNGGSVPVNTITIGNGESTGWAKPVTINGQQYEIQDDGKTMSQEEADALLAKLQAEFPSLEFDLFRVDHLGLS